jgi:hypothetical protein
MRVTDLGDATWFIRRQQGALRMSDIYTYENWQHALLIEERNEKPLRIALFAVVAVWAAALLIALA